MDKFGIFNLLGSLLNNKTNENPTSADAKNSNPLDLSGLINALVSPKKDTPAPTATPSSTPPKEFVPLQRSMLGVMNSHDEIIRRVKEKALTKHK